MSEIQDIYLRNIIFLEKYIVLSSSIEKTYNRKITYEDAEVTSLSYQLSTKYQHY